MFFILLFWFFRVILIFFRKNIIFILIGIEIINLSLSYIVIILKNNYFKFFRFFKYYYIQSFFIYLILVIIFTFSFNYLRSIFLLVLLLSKMNIFPRHIWINEVFLILNINDFFLLRVLSKISISLIILSFFKINYIIVISIIITFFWTILSIKNFNHLSILFSFSNLNSSCWLIIIIISPLYIFIIFFFFYSNIIICIIYNEFFFKNKNNILPIAVLNISRFPLGTVFFLKVILLNIIDIRNFFIILLLLLNSYVIFIYYKYILNLIFDIKKNYNIKLTNFFLFYFCYSFIFIFIF